MNTHGQFFWGTKTYVMGVINVTPDSFSGDGVKESEALKKAISFVDEGVDIIDVGGVSTRPPSLYGQVDEVAEEEEISRIIPVISSVRKELRVPMSVDTYRSEVASLAISEGAIMINDIWGLKFDPHMSEVVARNNAFVVLMHNTETPDYKDVVDDTVRELELMAKRAIKEGIQEKKIIIDPGIGFGKNWQENLEILRRLEEYKTIGLPLMVGTSRKSTIGKILDLPVDDRIEGTAATVSIAIAKGADIVRVHDVKEMVRVSRMTDAIVRG